MTWGQAMLFILWERTIQIQSAYWCQTEVAINLLFITVHLIIWWLITWLITWNHLESRRRIEIDIMKVKWFTAHQLTYKCIIRFIVHFFCLYLQIPLFYLRQVILLVHIITCLVCIFASLVMVLMWVDKRCCFIGIILNTIFFLILLI